MIQKQSAPLNFAQGLDTKTDSRQVQFGKFLKIDNSVFTTGNLLGKRYGYNPLTKLPNTSYTDLTTFGGNLTAIGNNLQAYSSGNESWTNKGNLQPLSLSVLPTARSALNQTQCDSAIASNNLVCTVYTEINNGANTYKYTIQDVTTGQYFINPTTIPSGTGTASGSARVFILGGYFIIVYTVSVSSSPHLRYVAVSQNNPTVVTTPTDLASGYGATNRLSWDGIVLNNNLYIAYDTSSGGQQIQILFLTSGLSLSAPVSFSGQIATIMSLCVDTTSSNPLIYAAYYDSASSTGFSFAVDSLLNKRMTPTEMIISGTVDNITCTAQNGVLTVAYEVANTYSYDSGIPTNFLDSVTVTLPATVTTGTVGSTTTFIRSLGLASKAFIFNSTMYMLGVYQSALQSTYFLIDLSGNIISRFAYENAGGYLALGLPQAQVIGTDVYIAYLYKDLLESQSTNGLAASVGPAGLSNIYSQTGVNLITFDFTSSTLNTAEIGGTLNLTGGYLYSYDGQTLAEQGFHLFPDNVEVSTSGTGGSITAQQYFYQVVYEWTDAAGNINRSAPSVPVSVTTTGSTSTNTINIPTLRLTGKSNVKIQIYRWSTANQIYYQITSLTAPLLNNKSADSVTYTDTAADTSIIGNNIIYTNGGVVEDIAGPASVAIALFDDRVWLIDAEDQNLLWFSKQVIEATPVEMSDLFTLYIAPSTGAEGSTGDLSCLFPMDDKLILFKENAIYYLNGTGPDNTGANSQYSQPIFITSNVGCSNQKSIVLTPAGLMFQSNKGIWLLGRGLDTTYIGAPVEGFNSSTVNSAQSLPGTTMVVFTISTGQTLMYDYYYGQWGTWTGVRPVSSTLYQDSHTVIDQYGNVLQQTIGSYLDNNNPVLMSFVTSWLNLTGLQGYQRGYFFYLLGQFLSPHFIQVGLAYDYNPSFFTAPLIKPTNYSLPYGGMSPYGQGSYGGPAKTPGTYGQADIENWRVFLKKQRCQAFQISIQEVYDPSMGSPAGAGFTLSGLNIIYGSKNSFRPISASQSVG